jgi:hypothetical protein
MLLGLYGSWHCPEVFESSFTKKVLDDFCILHRARIVAFGKIYVTKKCTTETLDFFHLIDFENNPFN